MSFNKGKQERIYHTFLDKKYRIDKLPCGVSIPFNVELNKLRKEAIEIVNNIDPSTLSKDLYKVLDIYYEENPDKAQEQMNHIIKTISVLTEFFTDGEIDEEYIKMNAMEDEVVAFIDAIQDAEEKDSMAKIKKQMRRSQ